MKPHPARLLIPLLAAAALVGPVRAEILEQVLVKVNGDIITKTDLEQRQVSYLRQRNQQFDPKDLVYVRIDRRRKLPATIILRALGYEAEEILGMFYDVTTFHVTKDGGYTMTLIPERLRGDVAAFDIKAGRKVVVEQGRHVIKPAEQVAGGGEQFFLPAAWKYLEPF